MAAAATSSVQRRNRRSEAAVLYRRVSQSRQDQDRHRLPSPRHGHARYCQRHRIGQRGTLRGEEPRRGSSKGRRGRGPNEMSLSRRQYPRAAMAGVGQDRRAHKAGPLTESGKPSPPLLTGPQLLARLEAQLLNDYLAKRVMAGLDPGSTDTGAYCKARAAAVVDGREPGARDRRSGGGRGAAVVAAARTACALGRRHLRDDGRHGGQSGGPTGVLPEVCWVDSRPRLPRKRGWQHLAAPGPCPPVLPTIKAWPT